MSNLVRSSIVIATGLLLIVGPYAWAQRFQQAFRAQCARQIRDAEVARGNGAAAQLSDDEILANGFGLEVSSADSTRLMIADLFIRLWWVYGLIVLGLCYGMYLFLRPPPANPRVDVSTRSEASDSGL